MTDLVEFLRATLAFWRVAGTVQAEREVVVVAAESGARLVVEAAPPEAPHRWSVRGHIADAPPNSARELRPRACGSLVGVLGALRHALGVDRGRPLRVAAPPPAPSGTSVDTGAPARVAAERTAPGCSASIPVTVLTGFLGSGKTTLLARLLRDPAMGRTAVVMNELGAVALDHDLLETSDESFVQLSTGCLCCRVRSDLVETLRDLAARRAAGSLPQFERVVVETTGLADPAPILQALLSDAGLLESYVLDAVVTTVDSVTGLATLDTHGESLRQAALADTLVITKTDLPEAQTAMLEDRLALINPVARKLNVVRGALSANALFEGRGNDAGLQAAVALDRLRGAAPAFAHRGDIRTVCIVRDEPIRGVALALFLSALAENCGSDLLRMKGIVAVAEMPDAPAVVHGVQHVFHAPEWLERWPAGDRRTRLVFIGRALSESWIRTLLALLESEVADELARRRVSARAAYGLVPESSPLE